MAKGGSKTQTVTNSLDPNTLSMQGAVYDAARQAAQGYTAPGVTPVTQGAIAATQGAMPALGAGEAGLQSYITASQNGLAALSGNRGAMAGFMDPYNALVMGDIQNRFGDLAQRVGNETDAQATLQRAFGGSRAAVTKGVAQSELGATAQQQLAQLASTGYGQAQQAAESAAGMGLGASGTLANFGLGAVQNAANLGDYQRQVEIAQNPYINALNMLKTGMGGTPYGTTTSQPITRGSPLTGALGGAAALSGLGPWGAVAGGLLGLFS